ncbi:hypothetical protein PAMP_004904 [Pampus punctatissimus]
MTAHSSSLCPTQLLRPLLIEMGITIPPDSLSAHMNRGCRGKAEQLYRLNLTDE